MWLGMAGGRPHRFLHNNFSSVCRIFTKLGHMIPLWKGKNPIYFRVKGQGHHYYKYNFWQQGRFHITLVLYIGSLSNLTTWLSCGRGEILFILGSKVKVTVTINIEFLTTGSFPHDNFSSVYWIFTKLDHMIPLWKGKKPIYCWSH
jgi:hypothetical protein